MICKGRILSGKRHFCYLNSTNVLFRTIIFACSWSIRVSLFRSVPSSKCELHMFVYFAVCSNTVVISML